jgi:hypothetical protein
MSLPKTLEDAEHETARRMRSTYSTEAELIDRILDPYLQGFQWLSGKHVGRRWHRLVLMLGARSFNSLRVAQKALLDGYPEQAIILVRAADEDVLTATYVGRHPREARFWLARKYTARKYHRGKLQRVIPGFDQMRRDLGQPQQRKRLEIYQALSQFGHPKAAGLRFIVTGMGDATLYRVGSDIDADAVFMANYTLIPTALMALALVGQFIEGKNSEWTQEALRMRDDVLQWLSKQNAANKVHRSGE